MTSDTLTQRLENLRTPLPFGKMADVIISPATEMRLLPFPQRYEGSVVGKYLRDHSLSAEGTYRHQVLAADAFDAGQDVVICTRTNSGKSRSFTAEAFHTVLQNPDARVLVFYPLKNLGMDQYKRWMEMAVEMGLPKECIGRLDGRVKTIERTDLIKRSRILLATPDVFHAWVMSNLAKPEIQALFKNRKMTVIDELDTLNGVFGTNMMFLLQRMEYLQRALSGKNFSEHRYIGASATLPNAQAFFKTLTGRTATVIDESDNGAPQMERALVHYAADNEHQFDAIADLIDVQLASEDAGQGIVFFDLRQKVERMTTFLNDSHGSEIAVAQKAGHTTEEQARLDGMIRTGRSRVIIATSSMESGVDYDFSWGINAGIPNSKRALTQRTGRIGRHQDGLFIIVDRPDAFKLKEEIQSLEDYIDKVPSEDPILYPANEFIQIANALCVLNEIKQLKAKGVTLYPAALQGFQWPRGFVKSLDIASKPDEHLTGERSLLVPPDKAIVHYFHSMRRMSGSTFKLCEHHKGRPIKDADFIGDCSLQQAIREYPPGAIVRHYGKKFRVDGWQIEGRSNRIIMTVYTGQNTTKHHVHSDVRITVEPENLVKGTFRQQPEDTTGSDPKPFMAITRGQSVETVTSFVEIDPYGAVYPRKFYDDFEIAAANISESERDYGPRRRSRISTTGLLMYIPNFRINQYLQVSDDLRDRLLEKILDEYCDALRINRDDVAFATEGILRHPDKGLIRENFVFFYDTTPGSLGLTHGLLTHKQHNLDEILERIRGKISDTKEQGYSRAARLFHKAFRDMVPADAEAVLKNRVLDYPLPQDHIIVSPPDSLAFLQQDNGSSVMVKIDRAVVHSGIPGYFIQVADRKSAFRSAQWVTVDPKTLAPVYPEAQTVVGKPTLTSRFISAGFIKPYGIKVMAMNVQTGDLMAPNDNGTWSPYVQDAKLG